MTPTDAGELPRGGSLAEILLAALLAAASFAVTLFSALPILAALGIPLAAVPAVRLAHRRGFAAGVAACALAGAAVFVFGLASGGVSQSFAAALAAVGVTAVPVAAVGFLRADSDPSRCYLGVCVAGCAFLLAAFTASAAGSGPSLANEVAASFEKSAPAIVDSYVKSGADASTLDSVKAFLAWMRVFTSQYLWGILGAFWVMGAAVGFYAGAASARPAATAERVRFEQLRLPALAAGLFVACGAAFAVLPGLARRAAGSVLLPLLALYFVAGLSIICHFVRKWFRSRILRACLYVLACYFPIDVFVALMGLFDWYVDFRRRGEGLKGVEKT